MTKAALTEKVIVLAGGFGTRLQEVVSDVPKPLAPVCGKPFLYYLLEDLIRQGARDFILSLYYQSDMIIDFLNIFTDNNPETITVEWVVEPEPLGTGGAVKYIIEKAGINGSFFVINGDTYIPDTFSQFVELSKEKEYAISIVCVDDASRYGAVVLDKDGVIGNFIEKSKSRHEAHINAGIYKMNSEIFRMISEKKFSMEDRVFPSLVNSRLLYGFMSNSIFIDIGIPEDYRKLCNYIMRGIEYD